MIKYHQEVSDKGISLPLLVEFDDGRFMRYQEKQDFEWKKEFFGYLEEFIGDEIKIVTYLKGDEPFEKEYILDGVYFKGGSAGFRLLPILGSSHLFKDKPLPEDFDDLTEEEKEDFEKFVKKIFKKK